MSRRPDPPLELVGVAPRPWFVALAPLPKKKKQLYFFQYAHKLKGEKKDGEIEELCTNADMVMIDLDSLADKIF